MAYSLVKYSFPKQYIEDVVLGKKFYDKKDIDDFIKERERSCKTKFPLAFIWGFKDPYNARLEGECDYKLGNERIRAFFSMYQMFIAIFTIFTNFLQFFFFLQIIYLGNQRSSITRKKQKRL